MSARIITTVLIATVTLLSNLPVVLQASSFTQLKGSPDIRSASALVIDADGHVIYGKDVDSIRPIASITKLMTAMVIIDSGIDMDEKITVSKDDRDLVQLTGSRLEYGATLSRRQMILIAIMSSENRAASALGRTYPGGMSVFVKQMNKKAVKLGMRSSHFADPAGLRVENQSTASDLAIMVTVASEYALIHEAYLFAHMKHYHRTHPRCCSNH